MSRNIAVGIDIGTYQVKVVVASNSDENERGLPVVLATGIAESKGLRHGYIQNQGEVSRSVLQAVRQAEKTAGFKIKDAFLSIGGVGLTGIIAQGSTVVARGDSEIAELDISKVQEACESEIPASQMSNRKIINAVPIQYKIDGKVVLGKPLGMKGMRLEAKMLFVTCLEPHLQDLIQAVEEAGIEVVDVVASPIAGAVVTLTKTQKIAGCVLANIGAETVSIVVYENNIPISLEVFPLGSTDITNDIALGLKIPLEEAEQIKLGAVTSTPVSKRRFDEIVNARLSDIFELIEAHLKKIGRSGLLPAGVIITGGGSNVGAIDFLAKSALRLPAKIGAITLSDKKGVIRDSTWSVAYGLCIIGLLQEGSGTNLSGVFSRGAGTKIWGWFKQFLP
ncbi:MAG TPA: cell division protein FtsA [Candidatus Paceibacterota bacterium]|nr:cell division protein FtsA [Candidatus Paceibacterota bacterium]